MGLCHGKDAKSTKTQVENPVKRTSIEPTSNSRTAKTPTFPFYSPSPLPSAFKNSPANTSVNSTPLRKRPFPPPSPVQHIKALLARRQGPLKPNGGTIPEGNEDEVGLNKNFGFSNQFFAKFELGGEVGRGHFGFTCSATAKKGELQGQEVAVKVIPKSKVRFLLLVLFFNSFSYLNYDFISLLCTFEILTPEFYCLG